MTEKLEDKLFERFYFYRPDLPETESLMCYGFECGDGWFQLLWKMSEEIEKALTPDEIDKHAKELLLANNNFNISQVKCKFGELRVYSDYSFTEVDRIIDKYTDLALFSCEKCGEEGEYRQDKRTVLCEKCYSKILFPSNN